MRSVILLCTSVCLLIVSSCVKPKEPMARICPDEPIVITTHDIINLESCSENTESQRWELPNNTFSTQNKVSVASGVPLSFLVKLSVRNADYSRDYVAQRKLKIVSKNFSTATSTSTLTNLTDEITTCTIVDDIDVTDPDGYYTTAGPPAGYELVENLGNGCYTYKLKNPANPPAGSAVTFHYFCIDADGGFCDTTRVVINTP